RCWPRLRWWRLRGAVLPAAGGHGRPRDRFDDRYPFGCGRRRGYGHVDLRRGGLVRAEPGQPPTRTRQRHRRHTPRSDQKLSGQQDPDLDSPRHWRCSRISLFRCAVATALSVRSVWTASSRRSSSTSPRESSHALYHLSDSASTLVVYAFGEMMPRRSRTTMIAVPAPADWRMEPTRLESTRPTFPGHC